MMTHEEVIGWVKAQAKAREMSMVELERAANVSRKTLYRALNSDGKRDTRKLPGIVAALGGKLTQGYEIYTEEPVCGGGYTVTETVE